MTRFHLVRHAPTHAKTMVGWTDLPADLSDQGVLDRLDKFLPRAPVISSDLGRAIATADMLCTNRPRLLHDPRFREINFGDWEGKTFASAEAENASLIRAFWETPGQAKAPGGECWDDITDRVWAGLDRYPPQPALIIVAHFGTIIAALQRALRMKPSGAFGFTIRNLSVTEIIRDGTGWSVGKINHIP